MHKPVQKLQFPILFKTVLLALVFSLSGCLETDQDRAIEVIKAENDLGFHQCVGANGTVKYNAFKSSKKPDNIVVVNVTLKRNGETFMIQNLFETNSQSYEATYMEHNGEGVSLFTAAFIIMAFCEMSFL